MTVSPTTGGGLCSSAQALKRQLLFRPISGPVNTANGVAETSRRDVPGSAWSACFPLSFHRSKMKHGFVGLAHAERRCYHSLAFGLRCTLHPVCGRVVCRNRFVALGLGRRELCGCRVVAEIHDFSRQCELRKCPSSRGTLHGDTSTCQERVDWTKENTFVGRDNACALAYSQAAASQTNRSSAVLLVASARARNVTDFTILS